MTTAAATAHRIERNRRGSIPMYTNASGRLIEYANSPAIVDCRLPPQAELPAWNRNGTVRQAPSAGPGKGTRRHERQKNAAAGSSSTPSTLMSLKATCGTTISEASVLITNGTGKYI